MGVDDGQSRSKKRNDAAAARRLIGEFLYPDTDTHFLDDDERERFKRVADAGAAEHPDARQVTAIENIVCLLSRLRKRTKLLRGKAITNITVTLCEDFSGYLGAELHHELCACVFCGPEELLDILRGQQAGQWFLQDESMPGE